jgi:hypothetical protein
LRRAANEKRTRGEPAARTAPASGPSLLLDGDLTAHLYITESGAFRGGREEHLESIDAGGAIYVP